MANNKQEQLDEAVSALNELLCRPEHTSGWAIHPGTALSTGHKLILRKSGHIMPIIDGWYYISEAGFKEWYTPLNWNKAYWDFVRGYMDEKYQDNWCLSSDMSLLFRCANGLIPRFLTVRSERARTRAVDLPHMNEIMIVEGKLPEGVVRDPVHGVRLYPLGWALLTATPWFYTEYPTEARTCLALLESAEEITETAIAQGFQKGASRVAGALESIGNPVMADEIILEMRRHGYRVTKQNPFTEDVLIPMDRSAISSRIRLLWKRMRPAVLEAGQRYGISPADRTVREVREMMGTAYTPDAVNTLLLQEYSITERQVIEAERMNWEDVKKLDREQRLNATAARGYRNAFDLFEVDILDVLTGGNEPDTLIRSVEYWHERMSLPMFRQALRPLDACQGFRDGPSYVKDTEHIPVEGACVEDAMATLKSEVYEEPDAFVRAVLGHFFILYIHPFIFDNAVMARLFMNSQLLTAGFPWTTVPAGAEKDYHKAIEKAKVSGEIDEFADLMAFLVMKGTDTGERQE